MASPLHRAAAALAQKGLSVFPCAPGAKYPATSHGCLDATTDIQVIDRWWTADPKYNVAIATGSPSGIFVLDIDGDGAELALAKFEAVNAPLPATVEVITGNGRHLWFRTPAGIEIRNSASRAARGIDVRGCGGYALSPPSIHPSGRRYCWSVDSARSIAEAPKWLLDKLSEPAGSNGATPL
jgi:hypothetical protein